MKYYQIDKEKNKELEEKLQQVKLKVNFDSTPNILRDGKFYTISEDIFTLYDDKFYTKILEIKLESGDFIISAIQLDNKDLVFLTVDQLIVIYRIKNEKYFLFQKIEDNYGGYELQNSHSGCQVYSKQYRAKYIKDISYNRFICVSNYGYKIYALNGKDEYSIALLESYHDRIITIHEIDKDNFIFCSEIRCGPSLGGPGHNILIIDKINIKEITKEEKEKKIKEVTKNPYYEDVKGFFGPRVSNPSKEIEKEEIKRVIESLRYTHNNKELIEYSSMGLYHYFKGNAILKNKYFLVGIDNNILIYDIYSGLLLIRYEVLIEGEDNLYECNANIKKWNNNTNNEFIMNLGGNIIMFELSNDNQLKIINQSYFKDINSLNKLNEKKNTFYEANDDVNNTKPRFRYNPVKNKYKYYKEENKTTVCIYY